MLYCQKCVKPLSFYAHIGHDFWSLDQLVVETLGVASVRSYVRSYVRHAFSRKPLITFLCNFLVSQGLQVREKCSKRFFENFHRFGHFGQKLSKMALFGLNDQKWMFFAFFSRTAHQNFLIFLSKHSLWSRKIITFSLFGGNFKNGPFWPKLTQI